ncbi:MAG TPA: YibE/F family protein [Firmicutes bacterium]|nr:YibE/F family protein [Bacillota bacterium]
MKKSRGLAILLAAVLLLGSASALSGGEYEEDWPQDYPTVIVRARVLEVSAYQAIKDDWFFTGRQKVTVEIMTGRFQGYVEEIENNFTGVSYRDLPVRKGDQVLLLLELDEGRLHSVNLYEFGRDRYLYILIGFFIFAVILIARTKGLKALLTLSVTGIVIVKGMLPLILQGHNPLVLTLLFSTLVTIIYLTVFGGLNAKTAAAIAGTMGGVLSAGLVAVIFGGAARLTGFNEDVQMLYSSGLPTDLDIRGLLFAGIILGALGAVMDLSLSISSSIFAIREANPLLTFKGMFKAGYEAGKERLARMINILMLAWAGCALPLLLLFAAKDMSYINVINLDIIATEAVRSIAGSFGLLAAAPAAAAAAALLTSKFAGKKKSGKGMEL